MDGTYPNISLSISSQVISILKVWGLKAGGQRKGEPFQLLIYNTKQEHIHLHSVSINLAQFNSCF